jgi:hypothetical protein
VTASSASISSGARSSFAWSLIAISRHFAWFGFGADIEVRRSKIKGQSRFGRNLPVNEPIPISIQINSNFTVIAFAACRPVTLWEPYAELGGFEVDTGF